MASVTRFFCPYCSASTSSEAGLASHIKQTPSCKAREQAILFRKAEEFINAQGASRRHTPADISSPAALGQLAEHELDRSPTPPAIPFPLRPSTPDTPPPRSENTSSSNPPTTSHPPPDKRARVEDVDDEEEPGGLPKKPHIKYFPRPAGTKVANGQHLYERIHEERTKAGLGKNPWAPFENEDEWYLARFLLMSGMSQGDIDRFLKLGIVSRRNAYPSKRPILTYILLRHENARSPHSRTRERSFRRCAHCRWGRNGSASSGRSRGICWTTVGR